MSLRELQSSIVSHCLGRGPLPSSLAPQRDAWALYRSMVQGRIIAMIEQALPRTTRALGGEAQRALVERWLGYAPLASPLLRELPSQFASWWLEHEGASAPVAQRELIVFERALWEVSFEQSAAVVCAPFRFDAPPVRNPTLRILHSSCGVQRDEPEQSGAATMVAVYRSPLSHSARWRELSSYGARWLHVSVEQPALDCAGVTRAAATALDRPVDPVLLDELSGALALWLEDGIVLGSTA